LQLRRPDSCALTGILERRTAGRGVVFLHDRRMPGSRGTIDHIAIGPSGVTVIDAKRYRGRIAVERELVDAVEAQADAVRGTLADGPHANVPVRAVLCFVDGDWPWSGPLGVRGVPVLGPREAAKLCAVGGLPAAAVTEIAEALRARLAPA
jgi:hypothetical protein